MSEQTTPATGVEQAPQDDYSKVLNYLNQSEPDQGEEPAPEEAPQAEPPAAITAEEAENQATEPTPDDLPPDEEPAQSAVDAFEIVHNGNQVKLTREEAIKYAMQGFDYTRKTQAVAEQQRALEQRFQAMQFVEQAQPHLMQEAAQVKAIEAQLGRFNRVDWVQLATNDPLEYPKVRAQYDVLSQAYNQAVGNYNAKQQQVGNAMSQMRAQHLQQEHGRLTDFVPEWKDQAKMEAGKQAVLKYIAANGEDPSYVDSKLDNAFLASLAVKAMKYDNLVKGKAEKSKQLRTVPPVSKPGASGQSASVKTEQSQKLTDRLRKTGSVEDAAALLLNRMK